MGTPICNYIFTFVTYALIPPPLKTLKIREKNVCFKQISSIQNNIPKIRTSDITASLFEESQLKEAKKADESQG